MKMKEAYYEVFRILDEYWEKTKIDDLGDMLSDMSPYTFKSDVNVSADPAEYEDWKDAWVQIVGEDNEATPKQIFSVALTLLDYYSNDVGYDLGEPQNVLQRELGVYPEQINIAV